MNIFILDSNIEKNAQYYVDKHVTKIQVECWQMMSMVIREYTNNKDNYENEFSLLNKHSKSHANHPCTLWIKESWGNFMYVYELMEALTNEHIYRFNPKNVHLSYKKMIQFFESVSNDWIENELKSKFKNDDLMEFAIAISNTEIVIESDPVQSYRNYYNVNKRHLHKWTKRETPYFIEV